MSVLASYLGGKQAAKQNAMAAMLPQSGSPGGNPMAAMGGVAMGGAPSGPVAGAGDMPELMRIASQNLGMNENDQNAALTEYLKNGGVSLDPAVTAWCAAYVNATLKQAGMEGTGSNLARDFLKWGDEVSEPQRGDIAVFSRGDPNGPYGHVGFFDGYNEDGTIRLLGGNQGDAVSYSDYSPDRLLGFRRAPANPMATYAGM